MAMRAAWFRVEGTVLLPDDDVEADMAFDALEQRVQAALDQVLVPTLVAGTLRVVDGDTQAAVVA